MNCRRFARILPGFAAGEITGRLRQDAEEHLRQCPKCAAEYAAFEKALQALSGCGELLEVPPELQTLRLPETAPRSAWWLQPQFGAAVLATLAIVPFVWHVRAHSPRQAPTPPPVVSRAIPPVSTYKEYAEAPGPREVVGQAASTPSQATPRQEPRKAVERRPVGHCLFVNGDASTSVRFARRGIQRDGEPRAPKSEPRIVGVPVKVSAAAPDDRRMIPTQQEGDGCRSGSPATQQVRLSIEESRTVDHTGSVEVSYGPDYRAEPMVVATLTH